MALEIELDQFFKEGIEDTITVAGQSVTATVNLDDESQGDEGMVDLDGTLLLSAADYATHFDNESGVVNTFEWDGKTYHVLPLPSTKHGLTICRIRLHSQHQKRAGFMGLNDEQAEWQ